MDSFVSFVSGVRSLSGLRRAAAARSVFDGFRDFQAEASKLSVKKMA